MSRRRNNNKDRVLLWRVGQHHRTRIRWGWAAKKPGRVSCCFLQTNKKVALVLLRRRTLCFYMRLAHQANVYPSLAPLLLSSANCRVFNNRRQRKVTNENLLAKNCYQSIEIGMWWWPAYIYVCVHYIYLLMAYSILHICNKRSCKTTRNR